MCVKEEECVCNERKKIMIYVKFVEEKVCLKVR